MPLSLLLLVGIAALGAVVAGAVRGFTVRLGTYEPTVFGVRSRFQGTVPETHDRMIKAISRVRGASIYSDEGSTVMVSTVPAVGIEGAFGMWARAELEQNAAGETTITWTAMPKTSWATSSVIQRRSLVQLERNIRETMKTALGAREIIT